jgi:hypothetical protein
MLSRKQETPYGHTLLIYLLRLYSVMTSLNQTGITLRTDAKIISQLVYYLVAMADIKPRTFWGVR